MGLNVAAGEGNAPKEQREVAKKGPRVAIISGIIDLGIQPQEYDGEKQRDCREFLPILTLVNDKYTDDEGKEHCMVTAPWPVKIKLGKKSNYTKFLAAADPNEEVLKDGVGDLSQLVGRPVFANMVHSEPNAEGIFYANCKGVSELPEDYPVPEVEINRVVFDTSDPDVEVFNKLWDRTKRLITGSVGYAGSNLEKVLSQAAESQPAPAQKDEPEDDDIPF